MGVSLRAGLRNACVCLLGIAAAFSIQASVPAKATHTQSLPIAVPQACTAHVLAASESEPRTKRLARRVFVEDTTPPTSDALKADRLPLAIRSYSAPRPAPAMVSGRRTPIANRQRAP
jgi:hypothetical protein